MSRSIDRRAVLRGLGTAIALPWLEAMAPSRLSRVATAMAGDGVAAPTRVAFLFVPNGVHAPDWLMPGGKDAVPGAATLPETLPTLLEPLGRVRQHVTVHAGLAHGNARALGDGPGDHARSAACFLTGAHPRKTAGSDIHNGVSFDQVLADHWRGTTRFDSLEIGCEPAMTAGNCD